MQTMRVHFVCIILGVLLMVRGKVYRILCLANSCCTLVV